MDLKYLEAMINELKNKDLVFATRYEKGGGSDDDDIITFIGNKIFSLIGKIFFRLKISDILFTYILGNTNKFNSLNLKFSDFKLILIKYRS